MRENEKNMEKNEKKLEKYEENEKKLKNIIILVAALLAD